MKKIITLVGDLLVDAGDLPLLLLVVLRLGQLHFPVQGDELTTGQFALFSRQFLLQHAEVAVVLVHRAVRQDGKVLQADIDADG